MIIQIRGTSGSGKSTIVREVMSKTVKYPLYVPDRKQPLLYRCGSPANPSVNFSVIGHYETKCGGCDTISIPGESYGIIFGRVRSEALEGSNVLFEGLLISGDINHTARLKDLGLTIIELTVPLEECLASVNERRRARMEAAGKPFEPVNPHNTSAKYKLIQKSCVRLERDHGITVERHDRAWALARVEELLHV